MEELVAADIRSQLIQPSAPAMSSGLAVRSAPLGALPTAVTAPARSSCCGGPDTCSRRDASI